MQCLSMLSRYRLASGADEKVSNNKGTCDLHFSEIAFYWIRYFLIITKRSEALSPMKMTWYCYYYYYHYYYGGSVAQWLEIRRSRVQDSIWSLVEFVPGSPWFNFPAALVNSRLVCLRPVGILNSCCCCVLLFRWLCFIGPEKPLWGVVN